MDDGITGTTALQIADSVRDLHERGALRAGAPLPSVRDLAGRLGVNRNTVVAAYRQLARAGLVQTLGRGGTRIAAPRPVAQEGYAHGTSLRDVGTGNPDPAQLPDLAPALAAMAGRPVLYGEPVIDAGLERWARGWMGADLPASPFDLTVTSGAVDAVERLLGEALARGDAVGLEDPCWLAGIHTVRLGGYRAVPIPTDAEGMTVAGLRAALAEGVRAVICTPRAQNPTGASLTSERAAALRAELAAHPYVLIIEDDHYSLLSTRPFCSLIGPGHRRFCLIRSVSKFLGPDMCLALTASDPHTAGQLALRLSPGTTWVSHLLQRLAHALLSDPQAQSVIARAGAHYAARNAAFAAMLEGRGVPATAGDGLNVWVRVDPPAHDVGVQLMRRGWLARTGDDFLLGEGPSHHLRLTVHDLCDEDAALLAGDVAAAAAAARSGVMA